MSVISEINSLTVDRVVGESQGMNEAHDSVLGFDIIQQLPYMCPSALRGIFNLQSPFRTKCMKKSDLSGIINGCVTASVGAFTYAGFLPLAAAARN